LDKRSRVVSVSGAESVHPGERTNPEGKPVSNTILLVIPDDEFTSIRPGLEYVDLPAHTVLQEPKQKLGYAYFLN